MTVGVWHQDNESHLFIMLTLGEKEKCFASD